MTITKANVLTPEPYSAANGKLVFKGVHSKSGISPLLQALFNQFLNPNSIGIKFSVIVLGRGGGGVLNHAAHNCKKKDTSVP